MHKYRVYIWLNSSPEEGPQSQLFLAENDSEAVEILAQGRRKRTDIKKTKLVRVDEVEVVIAEKLEQEVALV